MSEDEGVKFDNDKPKLSLISPIALMEVGKVFTNGMKKYGRNNWRKGISQSRMLDAALRHILWYISGEDFDPEPEVGCHHLAHAIVSLMMALELFYLRPDLDDRYKFDMASLELYKRYE